MSAPIFAVVASSEHERLLRIEAAAMKLEKYCHAVSYNGTYFGEAEGELKQVLMEFKRNSSPSNADTANELAQENFEDHLESAFWEFDARHKSTGAYTGRQMSERDAFKWTVRGLLRNGPTSTSEEKA